MDTRLKLTENLMRLLKHLNFSDIRIHNLTEFPDPEVNHTIMKEIEYIPPLIAQKNKVIYYFEFVEDNPKDLKKLQQPLQKFIELGHEQWDADFIIVTKYGNKDTVREWCQNYDLPVDQIWEM